MPNRMGMKNRDYFQGHPMEVVRIMSVWQGLFVLARTLLGKTSCVCAGRNTFLLMIIGDDSPNILFPSLCPLPVMVRCEVLFPRSFRRTLTIIRNECSLVIPPSNAPPSEG